MAWYIDTTRIFLTNSNEDDKSSVARLNPLGGGTIHHYWGWEEPIYKLKFYVVGNTDKNAISDMRKDGVVHTITGSGNAVSDWNWSMDGWVHSISWDVSESNYQTLRPELDCSTPVYVADMEFYKEE